MENTQKITKNKIQKNRVAPDLKLTKNFSTSTAASSGKLISEIHTAKTFKDEDEESVDELIKMQLERICLDQF